MKLLNIDLINKSYNYKNLSKKSLIKGGRALIAEVLKESNVANAYPLGPENKLIICNGALAGTGVSCSDRLSIGAKSPLTGGIKESNSGGDCARSLAKLNLRGIILNNKISDKDWYILKVDQDKIEFVIANEYLGLGNFEFKSRIERKYSDNYNLISIGPAGENLYLNSAIATTDVEGRPSRMAARGGLGAVMASKKIKGILINKNGNSEIKGSKSKGFMKVRKEFHKIIQENERKEVLKLYGTASTVMDVQNIGALPVRNFSAGRYEHADNISGERIYDIIKERGGEGKNSHACMRGCMIQCSNVYPDEKGEEIVSPLEYETIGLIGSNLDISDPDIIAQINYLCNDFGLDTIETGGALGVMVEAGLFDFGETDKFIEAIKDVPEGGWLGRLIGMGTGIAGKFLNVRRVPVVKNQCISAYDPRGVKGTGVTYVTNPMGADHTSGLTVFLPIDHHSKADQISASYNAQIGRTAYDSLGLCVFLMSATAAHPNKVIKMLEELYDISLSEEFLNELGRKVLIDEFMFNESAGIPKDDYNMPDFFSKEKLAPNDLIWDFTETELDKFFSKLKY